MNLTVTAGTCELLDFKSLPFEEQKAHFLQVATRALPLWGYPEDSQLKLLNITENATYQVRHPNYPTIAMRVHRLDYAELASIKTELAWIMDLQKDTSLHLATPLPALSGSYVQTITTQKLQENRHVVCFSFLEGTAPKDSHDDTGTIGGIASILNIMPKAITIPLFKVAAKAYHKYNQSFHHARKNTLSPEDTQMYRTLGSIAATLHLHSCQWTPPVHYQRIEWNWDATFGGGWNNFYGAHYRDIPHILKESDCVTIDACAHLMHTRLKAYGTAPSRYGMIHSDLRSSNLLIQGDQISVLDFDDCGKGWYLYDIAGIMGFMEHRPDLDFVIKEVVDAYTKIRPLSHWDILEIPTFIMMRRIGLLQAIIYHLDNTCGGSGESAELTPEILAFYAKGTAIMAKEYMERVRTLPLAQATEQL